MNAYDFDFKGLAYKAVNTGDAINGEALWEIVNARDAFVDTVTVHPFSTIADEVAAWIKFQR